MLYGKEKEMTAPWNRPINILDKDANQQIAEAGEEARLISMDHFKLICETHGVVVFDVIESLIEREEMRHRNSLECWHHIKLEKL